LVSCCPLLNVSRNSKRVSSQDQGQHKVKAS
jgi:hypothetical protein